MGDLSLLSKEGAQSQDLNDPLRGFRDRFIIPTKADLARTTVKSEASEHTGDDAQCTYLCGNSLGLQPALTKQYFEHYLSTWAQKGVFGHFKPVSDTQLPPWLDADDDLRSDMAAVVGAREDEVAMMQTLTANLHFLMCSFYRPTAERNKILIEGKAFPSDHFAVESQIRHHGYSAKDSMILLEPPSSSSLIIPTSQILAVIDKYASQLALILLPGIQYYTGQLFDIATITEYAHSKDIMIGWDLAHAAGNVPLHLHDWNVDFAAWCSYKYLNCGPGSIGGAFVHERHSQVTHDPASPASLDYRPRLAGWWGSQKSTRFVMANQFQPIPGAAGFQVSNTSVADSTAVRASLDIFKQTSMLALREKSLKLTAYLEQHLDRLATAQEANPSIGRKLFSMITPREPEQRGAQISVLLEPNLLESVMHSLEAAGVVVDERRPDVIRVAPAPLYNSYVDVWNFMQVFETACETAMQRRTEGVSSQPSASLDGGKESKGWSEIK